MYRRIHRLGGYLAALGICLLVICGLQALLLDQGRQEEPWATDRGGGVKEEKGEEKKSTGEDIGGEMGNPNIRVLIMSTGYENIAHPEVTVTATGGLVVESGQGTEEMEAGQPLTLRPDDGRFAAGKVRIQAKDGGDLTLASIKRGCGQPSYAGVLELRTTAEGIVIINELPVESYLCRVVPSEMPASYTITVNMQNPLVAKIMEAKNASVKPEEVVADAPSDATEEQKKAVREAKDAAADAHKKEIETFAHGNEILKQITDLALLANGMLKGKALSDFISRSGKVVADAYLK